MCLLSGVQRAMKNFQNSVQLDSGAAPGAKVLLVCLGDFCHRRQWLLLCFYSCQFTGGSVELSAFYAGRDNTAGWNRCEGIAARLTQRSCCSCTSGKTVSCFSSSCLPSLKNLELPGSELLGTPGHPLVRCCVGELLNACSVLGIGGQASHIPMQAVHC